MEAKIDELNDKEKAWIEMQGNAAKEFVAQFSRPDAAETLSLPALDRSWSAWLDSYPADIIEINSTSTTLT